MLRLGERVIVIGDSFEQHLPVGEYGYIIAYDRNPDNVFDYVVRVPSTNRNFLVTASDIEVEDKVIEQVADQICRKALIDYSLATYNEQLFNELVTGNFHDKVDDTGKEQMSEAEFIKQVNLRAWI